MRHNLDRTPGVRAEPGLYRSLDARVVGCATVIHITRSQLSWIYINSIRYQQGICQYPRCRLSPHASFLRTWVRSLSWEHCFLAAEGHYSERARKEIIFQSWRGQRAREAYSHVQHLYIQRRTPHASAHIAILRWRIWVRSLSAIIPHSRIRARRARQRAPHARLFLSESSTVCVWDWQV